ncbi:hypothetical protein ABG79_00449 [Caloramator mitchellensis]|uniref:DUF2935 domain-containing protein n=1 Tax=Caloramator mitchellensis TaxID=908809 RepID=A0A0R3JVP9_CALMK|nr:hypothetical protein ABG79_00449 [Caloramator mitchellensis]
MYCKCYFNNLCCVINEIILWSEISSEHPVFIKTVAALTNKNLSQSIVNRLNEVSNMFKPINERARDLKAACRQTSLIYLDVKKLIEEFLLHDGHFLMLIPDVKQYGKDDMVWQELLEHITHEQRFMFELFTNFQDLLD